MGRNDSDWNRTPDVISTLRSREKLKAKLRRQEVDIAQGDRLHKAIALTSEGGKHNYSKAPNQIIRRAQDCKGGHPHPI